jgi:glutamyl-tRNA synthetase
VIVRSNGTPVFFLANALDDVDMGITHVLRGEDLIDSTHRVLALRRALGHPGQPVYAHLPLILGPGGAKLSKRHGAVSVEEYREAGYLPSALLNYLALLGWGPQDGREVLTLDELVAEFELEHVNASAATFDIKKLEWMNGEHIRMTSLAELINHVFPFARERYAETLDIRRFEKAVELGQVRATTLVQIADQMGFLFVDNDNLVYDEASWEKLEKFERAADVLDAVTAHVESCEWDAGAIDLKPVIEPLGLKAGKVMHVIYTAIEGRSAGLPVYDAIEMLGRESALRRLRRASQRLRGERDDAGAASRPR